MGWLGWQHQQQEKIVAAERLQQPATELPRALNYDDIRQGDVIEIFEREEVERQL